VRACVCVCVLRFFIELRPDRHNLNKTLPKHGCLSAGTSMATMELSTLWNPKVLYRDHKNLPLVPILSQINPACTTQDPFKWEALHNVSY
jgi:hypothetical protein